ncbi:MAG: diphthine--ammonia ligase [Candidatus Anstonellaceae archaeon]
MRVAVLFSGGKDSIFAAEVCRMSGWEVVLLTIMPEKHSTMFHYPNIKWCKKQAEAMGLPILFAKPKKKGEESELRAMKKALAKIKVDGVAAGAIESEYQKERVDRIAHELGIKSFAPIWRTGSTLLSEQCEFLDTYVVAVAAEGLGEKELCRKFDFGFVEHIKNLNPPINPHLEGGEGETFVTNAPFFKKELKISSWKTHFEGSSGVAEIVSIA